MTEARQRGFTRTELIVVIVIVLVLTMLVTLLWTGCSRDSTGPHPRQLSNMRTLGQIHAIYAHEHRGELFNPFDASVDRADPWRIDVDGDASRAAYATADALSYYAAMRLVMWGLPSECDQRMVDPYDELSRRRFEKELGTETLIPGSYWYSATAYYNPARFAGPNSGSTARGATWENVRRNTMDDVRHPSRKVMFFEKQDFRIQEKLLFSHPNADVSLLGADGAVTRSWNTQLLVAMREDPSIGPSGGNWADPNLPDLGMDSQEEGLAQQQNLYPAFYHWTRDGIYGRDLW